MRSSFGKVFMGAAGGDVPSEDQFNRVSFLSHFDGANNGVNNAFDDGSASNHTITANGNVTQGSFGPFARPDGEWGWSFDSSAEGLVLNYGSTSHNYWNGNFTWEFWINTTDASSRNVLFGCWADNGMSGGSYTVGFTANGKINVQNRESSGGNEGPFVVSATAINDGAWHHIAITQVDDGGSTKYFRIFVDGVLDAYDTETSWTQGTSGQEITIGGLSIIASSYEAARRYTGLISNWRIVESIVYSTASTTIGATIFTPPTGPLTAITNTRILSCQSNRFVDNSTNGYVIGSNGNGKVSAFGPFLTSAVYKPAVNGASANFNGASDYITVADSSDFTLGNTFTLEAWIYPTASNNYNSVQNQNGSAGYYWAHVSGEKMQFYRGVTSSIQHDSAASSMVNQWTHVAYVCDAGTAYHYINGVRSGSSVSMSVADISAVISIGVQGSNFPFPGFISDYRMVVGTAVYSGTTYTIPTAPLTAITNTKLLLNMADGQAIDSAAQNNLTLLGNTDTSTGQAKFGNTSLFYDGSGDGAYYANGAALGTGDWTIETFLWVNDFDANLGVFQYGGADGALGSMVLTNQKIRVLSSAVAARLDTSGTINAQTWYHVAYVSYNGTLSVYINGTADSTTFDASSTTWTFTDTNIYVGARYYSSAVQLPFDGYLDEFRVSHFARYTSNFTAPTAAFADKGQ